jgi:nucleoside-diphosphate-sugar epimerase
VDERRLRPANSEVQRLCSDNRKAAELVGWRPAVSLTEGLKRTIEWVRASMDMYRPGEYRI